MQSLALASSSSLRSIRSDVKHSTGAVVVAPGLWCAATSRLMAARSCHAGPRLAPIRAIRTVVRAQQVRPGSVPTLGASRNHQQRTAHRFLLMPLHLQSQTPEPLPRRSLFAG